MDSHYINWARRMAGTEATLTESIDRRSLSEEEDDPAGTYFEGLSESEIEEHILDFVDYLSEQGYEVDEEVSVETFLAEVHGDAELSGLSEDWGERVLSELMTTTPASSGSNGHGKREPSKSHFTPLRLEPFAKKEKKPGLLARLGKRLGQTKLGQSLRAWGQQRAAKKLAKSRERAEREIELRKRKKDIEAERETVKAKWKEAENESVTYREPWEREPARTTQLSEEDLGEKLFTLFDLLDEGDFDLEDIPEDLTLGEFLEGVQENEEARALLEDPILLGLGGAALAGVAGYAGSKVKEFLHKRARAKELAKRGEEAEEEDKAELAKAKAEKAQALLRAKKAHERAEKLAHHQREREKHDRALARLGHHSASSAAARPEYWRNPSD